MRYAGNNDQIPKKSLGVEVLAVNTKQSSANSGAGMLRALERRGKPSPYKAILEFGPDAITAMAKLF